MAKWWVAGLLVLWAGMPGAARTIPGRVVDADGAAVSGADVTAYRAPGQVAARAVTAGGAFTLAVDDAVEKLVVIARQPTADLVGAAAWETVGDDVVIVAVPTVTVTGEVVDHFGDGAPLASVAVAQLRPQADGAPACVIDEPTAYGFPQLRTRADDQGRYLFRGVPQGWLGTTRAYAPGAGPMTTSPMVGRWSFKPATVTWMPRPVPRATEGDPALIGSVVGPRGYADCSGVTAELWGDGTAPLASAVTDDQGRYAFSEVPDGATTVVIKPPESMHLAPMADPIPEPPNDGSQRWRSHHLSPGVAVSGRVVERGTSKPWPGLTVRCMPSPLLSLPEWIGLTQEQVSAADGSFRFRGQPGYAGIEVLRDKEKLAECRLRLRAREPAEGIVLEVDGPQTLRVQLFDPNGQAFAGQRIRVGHPTDGLGPHVAMTDRYGGLDVGGDPHSWSSLEFVSESTLLSGSRVVAKEDGHAKVQITLSRQPRRIVEGTVLDVDGRPVPDAPICIRLHEGDCERLANPRLPSWRGRTTADGRFGIPEVPRGVPFVLTVDAAGCRPQRRAVWAGEPGWDTPVKVILTAAQRTVRGVVRSGGGVVSEALVFAVGLLGPQPVLSDAQGSFTLEALPDANVRVCTISPEGSQLAVVIASPGQARIEAALREDAPVDWHGAPTPDECVTGLALLREAVVDSAADPDELGGAARLLARYDPEAAVRALAALPSDDQKCQALLGWLRREPQGTLVPAALDRMVVAIEDERARILAAARLAALLPATASDRAEALSKEALRGLTGVPARLHDELLTGDACLSLLVRAGMSADDSRAELKRLLGDGDEVRQGVTAAVAWVFCTDLKLARPLLDLLTEPVPRLLFQAAWVRDLADVDPEAALALAQRVWPGNGPSHIAKPAPGKLQAAVEIALDHLALRLLPSGLERSQSVLYLVSEVPWPADERALWVARSDDASQRWQARELADRLPPTAGIADLLLVSRRPESEDDSYDLRMWPMAFHRPLPSVGEDRDPFGQKHRETDADLAYAMSLARPGRSRYLCEQILADDDGPRSLGALAIVAHEPLRAVKLCREVREPTWRAHLLAALGQWFLADERGRRTWLPSRPEPLVRYLFIPGGGAPDGDEPVLPLNLPGGTHLAALAR